MSRARFLLLASPPGGGDMDLVTVVSVRRRPGRVGDEQMPRHGAQRLCPLVLSQVPGGGQRLDQRFGGHLPRFPLPPVWSLLILEVPEEVAECLGRDGQVRAIRVFAVPDADSAGGQAGDLDALELVAGATAVAGLPPHDSHGVNASIVSLIRRSDSFFGSATSPIESNHSAYERTSAGSWISRPGPTVSVYATSAPSTVMMENEPS